MTPEEVRSQKSEVRTAAVGLAAGGPMTRDEQILSLAHRVSYIARRVKSALPAFVSIDDLQGEGWIGAIYAVDHWDARQGSLATYSRERIRGAMLDYLRRLDPISRQDRTAYKRACASAHAADLRSPPNPYVDVEIDRLLQPPADRRTAREFRQVEARADLTTIIRAAKLTHQQTEVVERHLLGEEPGSSIFTPRMTRQNSQCRVSQLKRAAMQKLRAAA